MSTQGDAAHIKLKRPLHGEDVWLKYPAGYNASAEGGNRTLIPVGNTILSRARLPIPPLRLSVCVRKYTTLDN